MKKYNKELYELDDKDIKFTRIDILDKPDKIDISSSIFLLTGTFTVGKRSQVKKLIEDFGGIVKDKSVTQDLDYLVVGEVTTQGWKYVDYGIKIKKALDLKKEKYPISIIGEQTLMKNINNENADENLYEDKIIYECFKNIQSSNIQEYALNESLEEIPLYISIENPKEQIYNVLKLRVKYFSNKLSNVKYLYENIDVKEKKIIKEELTKKILLFLIKSLKYNLTDISKGIDSLKTLRGKKNRLQNDLKVLYETYACFSKHPKIKQIIEDFKTMKALEIDNV